MTSSHPSAEVQVSAPGNSPAPQAAYIHVPFCARRCGYCNFTVLAGRQDLVEPYLEALARELSGLAAPRPVATLFIGGGTPTQLALPELRTLLETVRQWHPLLPDAEFSVEANPADVTAAKLELLAEFGVNRLSLGAQSFEPKKLKRLERDHTPTEIRCAIELAKPRMHSVSLDLIFAAPEETPAAWSKDLEAALELEPNHISVYGLTIEPGTTFFGRLGRGQLAELADETQRTMFLMAIDRLTAAGFEHYEVSNYATPGHRCRHNEVYWRGEPYFAAGPGAARYIDGRRETNHRSTLTWLKRIAAGESPVAESEMLASEDRAREALVLALRRLPGVDRAEFQQRFGISPEELAGEAIQHFRQLGFLSEGDGRLQLTREGLLISDALWPHLLVAGEA